MRAHVGDELVVKGRHVGDDDRVGTITDIHGEDGAPPFVVTWEDGHESIFIPTSAMIVEHRPAGRKAR